jgi:hypothetical protein
VRTQLTAKEHNLIYYAIGGFFFFSLGSAVCLDGSSVSPVLFPCILFKLFLAGGLSRCFTCVVYNQEFNFISNNNSNELYCYTA